MLPLDSCLPYCYQLKGCCWEWGGRRGVTLANTQTSSANPQASDISNDAPICFLVFLGFMKHRPFSWMEKNGKKEIRGNALTFSTTGLRGLTWLVEVGWQLPGHCSRDVALLAGSQRGLVRGVSFGSGVCSPAGSTSGQSSGWELVSYTRTSKLAAAKRNANSDPALHQQVSESLQQRQHVLNYQQHASVLLSRDMEDEHILYSSMKNSLNGTSGSRWLPFLSPNMESRIRTYESTWCFLDLIPMVEFDEGSSQCCG